MSRILELEQLSRIRISALFRFLIIGYSIFILFYKGAIINWWLYLGITIIYVMLYFFLRIKDNIWSVFRLFLDYIYIGFILYFLKDKVDIFGYSLIFLPILNAPNHSGNKRSLLLYIFPIIILCLLLGEVNLYLFVPFFLFFIVNNFEYRRNKKHVFYEQLNSLIDNYYIGSESFHKPYEIFKNGVRLLNENNVFQEKIDGFYGFINNNNKAVILYGSNFVGEYEFKDYKAIIKKKSDSPFRVTRNIEVYLNNRKIENNILYTIYRENADSYSFLLTFENEINLDIFFKIRLYKFKKILDPFLHRLAKVLDGDFKNKNYKLEQVRELEKHFEYISKARNMMHYIRNNLSPLKTFLSIQQDLDTEQDPKQIEILKIYEQKTRAKLETSSKNMLDTAKNILEQSKNPYSFLEKKEYSIEHLFSEIRNVWYNYFDEDGIRSNVNFLNSKSFKLFYNQLGIIVLLDNWISNMYRHKANYAYIEILEEDFIVIKFSNDMSNEKSKELKSYLSLNKDEILNKKTHGLLHIKKSLEDMDIVHHFNLDGNMICLEIQLKKITNENINI